MCRRVEAGQNSWSAFVVKAACTLGGAAGGVGATVLLARRLIQNSQDSGNNITHNHVFEIVKFGVLAVPIGAMAGNCIANRILTNAMHKRNCRV